MSSNIETTLKLIEDADNGGADTSLPGDPDDVKYSSMDRLRKKLWCKSKRWIFALTCLCVLLTIALIICFIKYRLRKYADDCCDYNGVAVSSSLTAGGSLNNGSECLDDYDDEFYEFYAGNRTWNSSRLPGHLRPYYYNIDLRISVYDKNFTGNSTIRFTCFRTLPFVVIHADTNLVFKRANGSVVMPVIYEIWEESNMNIKMKRQIDIKRMAYNAFFSYYVIDLDKNELFRRQKKYMIVFEKFSSIISNNLKGIYYSTYTKNNQNRYNQYGVVILWEWWTQKYKNL
jgi:hypothetical protein